MQRRSPAQVYALVFGITLVAVGILGFFYEGSFATGDDTPREGLLGIFDVNGWHNVVHIASGVVGLAVAGSWTGARIYALGFGAVYTVVAIWGFILGDDGTILGLIPVNTPDDFLHLGIAVAGIGAGLATPASPPPTTARPDPARAS